METKAERLREMSTLAVDELEATKGDVERALVRLDAAIDAYAKALIYQGECQQYELTARMAVEAMARRKPKTMTNTDIEKDGKNGPV